MCFGPVDFFWASALFVVHRCWYCLCLGHLIADLSELPGFWKYLRVLELGLSMMVRVSKLKQWLSLSICCETKEFSCILAKCAVIHHRFYTFLTRLIILMVMVLRTRNKILTALFNARCGC